MVSPDGINKLSFLFNLKSTQRPLVSAVVVRRLLMYVPRLVFVRPLPRAPAPGARARLVYALSPGYLHTSRPPIPLLTPLRVLASLVNCNSRVLPRNQTACLPRNLIDGV